jgi:hypothetical protein
MNLKDKLLQAKKKNQENIHSSIKDLKKEISDVSLKNIAYHLNDGDTEFVRGFLYQHHSLKYSDQYTLIDDLICNSFQLSLKESSMDRDTNYIKKFSNLPSQSKISILLTFLELNNLFKNIIPEHIITSLIREQDKSLDELHNICASKDILFLSPVSRLLIFQVVISVFNYCDNANQQKLVLINLIAQYVFKVSLHNIIKDEDFIISSARNLLDVQKQLMFKLLFVISYKYDFLKDYDYIFKLGETLQHDVNDANALAKEHPNSFIEDVSNFNLISDVDVEVKPIESKKKDISIQKNESSKSITSNEDDLDINSKFPPNLQSKSNNTLQFVLKDDTYILENPLRLEFAYEPLTELNLFVNFSDHKIFNDAYFYFIQAGNGNSIRNVNASSASDLGFKLFGGFGSTPWTQEYEGYVVIDDQRYRLLFKCQHKNFMFNDVKIRIDSHYVLNINQLSHIATSFYFLKDCYEHDLEYSYLHACEYCHENTQIDFQITEEDQDYMYNYKTKNDFGAEYIDINELKSYPITTIFCDHCNKPMNVQFSNLLKLNKRVVTKDDDSNIAWRDDFYDHRQFVNPYYQLTIDDINNVAITNNFTLLQLILNNVINGQFKLLNNLINIYPEDFKEIITTEFFMAPILENYNNFDLIDFLEDIGVDFNEIRGKNGKGISLLGKSVISGNFEACRYYINKGANIDTSLDSYIFIGAEKLNDSEILNLLSYNFPTEYERYKEFSNSFIDLGIFSDLYSVLISEINQIKLNYTVLDDDIQEEIMNDIISYLKYFELGIKSYSNIIQSFEMEVNFNSTIFWEFKYHFLSIDELDYSYSFGDIGDLFNQLNDDLNMLKTIFDNPLTEEAKHHLEEINKDAQNAKEFMGEMKKHLENLRKEIL